MGTIVHVHYNNIVTELDDWQIKELMDMLEDYINSEEA